MRTAIKAYSSQRVNGWARIDMLLAIYDGALDRIRKADAAGQSDEPAVAETHRLAAQRLILQLIGGIDLKYGEVSEKIRDLCLHVMQKLNEATPEAFAHSIQILETLRAGFEGIREEAIELESQGQIPAVRVDSDVSLIVE